jgi:hypothetical protein
MIPTSFMFGSEQTWFVGCVRIRPWFPSHDAAAYRPIEAAMSTIGWQGRLNEASSQEDVVFVCRQFLGLWTPQEIAELPEVCRPKDRLDVDDVNPYAIMLIWHLGIGDRATAPMLHRMSTFFTRAALRLAEIRAQVVGVTSERRKSRDRSP